MDASERMIERVNYTRKEAAKAESSYDFAASMLEIKSSRSIDLFSDSALTQVADIAQDARAATDELYTSYQMLVRLLDEECRPLMSENPSTRAVKEVLECIKFLNSESRISTNFTGSINGSSVGGLASSAYVPTMENQLIERWWEQKYNEMPGALEENKAFANRQAEARKAEAARRKAELEAEREYKRAEREHERREKEEIEHKRALDESKMAGDILSLRLAARFAKAHVAAEYGGFDTSFLVADMQGRASLISDRASDAMLTQVSRWRNVIKVLTNSEVFYGLTADGSLYVVSNTNTSYGEGKAARWGGLGDFAVGDHVVFGLMSDGRVVTTAGTHANSTVPGPQSWTDIESLWCEGSSEVVAKKRDGSLVSVSYNYYGRSDSGPGLPSAPVIMASMSSAGTGVAYLLENGRVETSGGNHMISVENLNTKAGIIDIAVMGGHTIAVYHDGTIGIAHTRENDAFKSKVMRFIGQHNLNGHTLAITGNRDHIVFITREGEIYQLVDRTLGRIASGKLEGFKLFADLEELVDRVANPEKYARLAREKEAQLRQERILSGVCTSCGGSFKKMLFWQVCSACGQKKDY